MGRRSSLLLPPSSDPEIFPNSIWESFFGISKSYAEMLWCRPGPRPTEKKNHPQAKFASHYPDAAAPWAGSGLCFQSCLFCDTSPNRWEWGRRARRACEGRCGLSHSLFSAGTEHLDAPGRNPRGSQMGAPRPSRCRRREVA